MKKTACFLIICTLFTSLFSSCAERIKYPFDSPYVYENYVSDTPTLIDGNLEETPGIFDRFGYPRPLEKEIEAYLTTYGQTGFAVLRVSRKNSESFFWEAKAETDEYHKSNIRNCAYTLTTLNLLEVLDGTEEFTNTLGNEINVLEPYGIDPDGNLVDYYFEVGNIAVENVYGATPKRMIDNDEEFVILIFDKKVISSDIEFTFSRLSEPYVDPRLEGAYIITEIAPFTEKQYKEAKKYYEENYEKTVQNIKHRYVLSGLDIPDDEAVREEAENALKGMINYYMPLKYWEKTHPTED